MDGCILGNTGAAIFLDSVLYRMLTCKAHKVNPRNYLNDVIAKMPYMQKATYDELLQMLPHKWKEIQKE